MKLIFTIILCYLSISATSQQADYYVVGSEQRAAKSTHIQPGRHNVGSLAADHAENSLQLTGLDQVAERHVGTPFYGDRWFMGSIILENAKPVRGFVSFNVVKNTVYFASNGSSEATQVYPKAFEIGGRLFQQIDTELTGGHNTYYHIVSFGNPTVVAKYTGKRSMALREDNYCTYSVPADARFEGYFEKHTAYYFIVGNKLVPVKAKKSFYRSIGVYGAKAKSLVTKFTLSLKSSTDIVRLAQLLNQTKHVTTHESGL